MSNQTDIERQLIAFAATLEHETAGPISPLDASIGSRNEPPASNRRRWARVLVGVASGLVIVLAGVVVLNRDSQPSDGPAATPPTSTMPSPTTVEVQDRYLYSPNGSVLFPSPDGRWYLDQRGCVVPTVADAVAACPDDRLTIKSAAWAPDSSLVAFDEAAFDLLGGSDIYVARVENQNTEPGTPPSVEFDNLTSDSNDETVNVMPLVLGDQIRFLRLSDPQPDSLFELVTIDLDGNVTATTDTDLPVRDLAVASAVLVGERHVVIGRLTETQRQLLTIAADGRVESQSPPDETTVRLFANADRAAIVTFDVDGEPAPGRVSVFDGTSLDDTGLPAIADGFLDPHAVDVSPSGGHILAAYSSDVDEDSTALRVWDPATSIVTDIGTISGGPVRALRWTDDTRLIVFTASEILEISIR